MSSHENDVSIVDKQNKQGEYRDSLEQQMREADEKKQLKKMQKMEDEEKTMQEFNAYYRYGRNVGGGSPIKDKHGQVIS